jgi:hypothetical protein
MNEALSKAIESMNEAIHVIEALKPKENGMGTIVRLRAALSALSSAETAEPIQFLCNATRFRLNFNGQKNCTSLVNFADSLQGQWVALVPAENDRHMKMVAAPQQAAQPAPQPVTKKSINLDCSHIERLRELAQAASDRGEQIGETSWYGSAEIASGLRYENPNADTDFIAGATPTAVLALYDTIDSLRIIIDQERAAQPAGMPVEIMTVEELREKYGGVIDANKLEQMAKARPDECFLKGSGVLKLIGAIRQLECEAREVDPAPAGMTEELPPLPDPFDRLVGHEAEGAEVFTADQMREYALLSRSNAPQQEVMNGCGMLTAGVIAWALITPTGNIRYWSTSRKAIEARQAQCPNESLAPIVGVATTQPEAVNAACQTCDGTGDVHDQTGEYRGACTACEAVQPESAQPAPMPAALPTDEMQLAGAQAIRFDTTPLNKLWTANAVFKAMMKVAPAALPLPAQQVQNKQEIHDALQKAFMTLQSSGGEDRSIVLKFNRKENAYIVHDFLLHCAVKDDPSQGASPSGDAK